MISFIIAWILFWIQIPIEATILALKAGGGLVRNQKTRQRINKQYGDGENLDLKQRLEKTGKKAGNNVRTVASGAKTTVKTTAKFVKRNVKLAHKTVKMAIKEIKLLIKLLKALIALIKAIIALLSALTAISVVLVIAVVIILIGAVGYTVIMFANDDEDGGRRNIMMAGGNNTTVSENKSSSSVNSNVDTSSLEACCRTMAEWYIANVHTYQYGADYRSGTNNRKMYPCNIIPNGEAGDDCSGFASAYASLVSGKKLPVLKSDAFCSQNQTYKDAGWICRSIKDVGGLAGLLPGDIVAVSGHVEVYVAPDKSFGWGTVRDHYPLDTVWSEPSSGVVHPGTDSRNYMHIYRFEGKVGG